jgi:DNA replication licensing factor MCM4
MPDDCKGFTSHADDRSGGSTPRRARRGDIHSSALDSSPSLQRRGAGNAGAFGPIRLQTLDESDALLSEGAQGDGNGENETTPRRNGQGHPYSSAPTLSAMAPSGEAGEDDGPDFNRVVWGTNIVLDEAMTMFRTFLSGFKIKYRAVYNAQQAKIAVENGGTAPPSMPLYDGLSNAKGEQLLYEDYLTQMRETGITNLNLDLVNLLAYSPAKKLYQQVVNYPQELVPILDQVLRDVMVDKAHEELQKVRTSFAEGLVDEAELRMVEDAVGEADALSWSFPNIGGMP